MKNKMKMYKEGGVMVGLNGNLKVQTIPGSKGVMPGMNSSVSAQNVAKGWAGGKSKAPQTAVPKAKLGMSMRKK
jgi:hypothetical protein